MDPRFVLALAGWCVGWWLLWRVPTLAPRPGSGGIADLGEEAPTWTAIIPARNEESSLGALLDSLAHQTVPPAQILVVDDQSHDATAAVAAVPGVTVVSGGPVPDGWAGKPWACHQGAVRATTDLLVFLDADVTLAPGAAAVVLADQGAHGGLLSVQPFHRTKRPYERLSAVFNVVAVMGSGCASPRRRGRSGTAFGPCLVTRRSDYNRIGGHASVRAEVIEDIALARRYAADGLGVRSVGGGGLISFRMYPDGLGQLVQGWSKNIASGAGSISWWRAGSIAGWVSAALTATSMATGALADHGDARVAAVVLYVLFVGQLGVMLRPLGTFGWFTAAAYPLAMGFFVGVFARSVYLTVVRRRVTWRDRSIFVPTSPPKP